jgi:hypothetical protein
MSTDGNGSEGDEEVYMEEVRDWSVLQPDLVRSCAERLDCNVDRMNMSGQCKAWLGALGFNMREKQLPWMLVPYRRTSWLNPSVISRAHFFCFLSHRAHKLPLPPLSYTIRYIGSTEGGWFVVAYGQTTGYALLNLNSSMKIDLPSTILAAPMRTAHAMVLRAATLSCSPADAESCIVGAICTTLEPHFLYRTFLAFARIGGSVFTCASEIDAEDVAYFKGSFYSVTRLEDLVICTPEFNKSAPPNSFNIERKYLHFLPIHHGGELCVKGRYLVESRGELLMVVRYSSMLCDQTSSFALFRMSSAPVVLSGPYYTWERLDHLEDRMVFVGKGNSRCFRAYDFTQCKPGVYFYDDDAFNMPDMVAYGFKGRKFPCFDNGCWPGLDRPMKKWYEWRLPSTYTSPTWYLH